MIIKPKNLITVFLAGIILLSCNRNEKINLPLKTELLFDSISSTICDSRFPFQKMIITAYTDSVLVERIHTGGKLRSYVFYNHNGNLFEVRPRINWYYENEGPVDFRMDTILTFSIKDITFVYDADDDIIIGTIFDYSIADSKYEIKKNGNTYKTIKQSLVDTTYMEIFFYDKKYNIHKFINLWQGNECVYVISNTANSNKTN
jgi:hypothetical protein